MSKTTIYNVPHPVFQHMIRGAHSQYRDVAYWKSTIEPLINIWNSPAHLNPSTASYSFNFDQISEILRIITIPPNMESHPNDTQRFNMFMLDLTTNWSTTSYGIPNSPNCTGMSQGLVVMNSAEETTIVNVEVNVAEVNVIGIINMEN
jgi:hypothetical protein